jgi:hypothetical protein
MDELTLLRELDAEAPPLTQRARLEARARLEREIARPPAPRSSPNGHWAAWALLAVTLVGAAIVIARDLSGDPAPPTASDLLLPEPAPDVLELAAAGGEDVPLPPAARPDQYLYTREVTEATPVDPGGTPRRFVEEEWWSLDGQSPTRSCELGRCWTSGPGMMNIDELRRLPRDPRDLMLYARSRFVSSPPEGPLSRDEWISSADLFNRLLATPLIVPPDLRAAALEALAYAPEVSVVDDEFEFRGHAAALVDIPMFGSDLIVDRDTHEYLGSRWELGPADMKGPNEELFRSSRVRLFSYLVEAAVVDGMGDRP